RFLNPIFCSCRRRASSIFPSSSAWFKFFGVVVNHFVFRQAEEVFFLCRFSISCRDLFSLVLFLPVFKTETTQRKYPSLRDSSRTTIKQLVSVVAVVVCQAPDKLVTATR